MSEAFMFVYYMAKASWPVHLSQILLPVQSSDQKSNSSDF